MEALCLAAIVFGMLYVTFRLYAEDNPNIRP